jgi:hypothetical protein
MALQGVQGLSPTMQAFVHMVRGFIRDHAELNRLIAGEESSDRIIAWAVMDALSQFNGTPHFTNYSLEELLAMNQTHLLTRMTTVALLESVGLLQMRNHLNYSDGGLNVGVSDKTPLILNFLQYFRAFTDQALTRAKVAMNMNALLNGGSTGVFSEFWFVNNAYLSV